jgi:hypothetical protein
MGICRRGEISVNDSISASLNFSAEVGVATNPLMKHANKGSLRPVRMLESQPSCQKQHVKLP